MNTETPALDFKSATLYAIRVVLHSADPQRLEAALAQRMKDAGSFFENEPVVVDATHVEEAIAWEPLLQALRRHNLPPIGVMAGGANLEAARAAGLAPVELSTPPARPQATVAAAADVPAPMPDTPAAATRIAAAPAAEPESAPENEAQAVPEAQPAEAPATSALIINRPLRSGQRVYARHTDVIIVGMVSQGAEVIADGNVHVYGPLRGKAMAGARGDTSARIFTTQLDPELLAIAGVYRVVEDKLDASLHNRPALIRLEGETLHVEALKG